jgi:glycyl-tRNA synthetase alpha chain
MLHLKESFFSLLKKMENFWIKEGCSIVPSYDIEMGAGTFHPFTILGSLIHKNWKFAVLQPCRRPGDSMSGQSSNRFVKFHQYQVILKPFLKPIKEYFLESLVAIGFNLKNHNITFIEGKWESPTLGAFGLGWEVRCDLMEICQITYFTKLGGIELRDPIIEFAYGFERLLLKINKAENLKNVMYDKNISMNDFMYLEEDFFMIYKEKKIEFSDVLLREHIDTSLRMVDKRLFFAAYDEALKANHMFNCLESNNYFNINSRRDNIRLIQKIFSEICRGIIDKQNIKLS